MTPPTGGRGACAAAALLLLPGLLPAVGAAEGPAFVDVAAETGLTFVHFNGMSGQYYIVEMMGPGGALFDYDVDGDLDVYLGQGTMLPADRPIAEALLPPPPGQPPGGRLFRNDAARRPGGGLEPRFVDVTDGRLEAPDYAMGVSVGDVDNDGFPDLYLTHLGPNRLLLNRGDGSFADATATSGADDARWSAPASFVDFDGDGRLDLYVGNYTAFTLATHTVCPSIRGEPDYCGPQAYPHEGDRLLRGLGGGRFEDVTARALAGHEPRATLGVKSADFDGDGATDLYVANDLMPNNLWINQGDGTFRDEALLAGCAVDREGRLEASMGVDAGDFDRDGDEDLFMTHLAEQTNTLYVNDGAGLFTDRTRELELAAPSWRYTGFGALFVDVDNDGWLDLAAVNGAVTVLPELRAAGDPHPLDQPNQLFRNLAGRRFEELPPERAGDGFSRSEVSRGLARGDVDNDGDSDLLLTNNAGPARLLDNRVGAAAAWIGFRLLGPGGRDDLGAEVVARPPGAPSVRQRVSTDGSYLAASDPRPLLGLGDAPGPGEVEVRWPGGAVQVWRGLAPGRYYVARRPGE